MDLEKFERQRSPNPSYYSNNVFILGAGGFGTWCAITLCMSGVVEALWIMDDDVVEKSNLNRLPYTNDFIGMKKVEAIKKFITDRRGVNIFPIDGRLTPDVEIKNAHIVDYAIQTADDEHSGICFEEQFSQLSRYRTLYLGGEHGEYSIRNKPVGWSTGNNEYDNIWIGTPMVASVHITNLITRRSLDLRTRDRITMKENPTPQHQMKSFEVKTLAWRRACERLEKLNHNEWIEETKDEVRHIIENEYS